MPNLISDSEILSQLSVDLDPKPDWNKSFPNDQCKLDQLTCKLLRIRTIYLG